MMISVILYLQFLLAACSVLMNFLGLYCLPQQKRGSKNQCLLQQNLSTIDITKILYDFVPIAFYYLRNDWYNSNYQYFDVVEIHMMTILYSSYILLLGDRLACVLLDIKYSAYLTKKLVRNVIFSSWLTGIVPGVLVGVVFPHKGQGKVYYYIAFDGIVITMTIITYTVIMVSIRKMNNRRIPSSTLRNKDINGELKTKRSMVVTFLLLSSFLSCYIIPDIVFVFHKDIQAYQVISLFWSLGFLLDPIIYISLNNELKGILLKTWKRLLSKTLGHLSCKCTSRPYVDQHDDCSLSPNVTTVL